MGYNNSNVDDLLPPEENDDDLNKSFIFPHSVMVSAEAVRPTSTYFDLFGKSIFTIYLDIYSNEIDSNYTANLNILDITGIQPDTFKTFSFKTLQDEYFVSNLKSLFLVFLPFKRNILNFEKGKKYSMKQYLDFIARWIPKKTI